MRTIKSIVLTDGKDRYRIAMNDGSGVKVWASCMTSFFLSLTKSEAVAAFEFIEAEFKADRLPVGFYMWAMRIKDDLAGKGENQGIYAYLALTDEDFDIYGGFYDPFQMQFDFADDSEEHY